MTIRGLIFDKDGTLFDFRRSWGVWSARLLARLTEDAALQARLAEAIGYYPDRQDFHPESPVIAGTAPEIAEALLPHLPGTNLEALVAQMNALSAEAEMVQAVPLRPLFQSFRDRGLVIGLATNDTELPARRHLEAHDLLDLFDFVAGYDFRLWRQARAGAALGLCAADRAGPLRNRHGRRQPARHGCGERCGHGAGRGADRHRRDG